MRPLKLTLTLEKVKNFLKIDFDDDDELINDMIQEAANEARGFLNTDFHTYDENGLLIQENDAPAEVNAWVRNRVAELYENRGNAPEPNFKPIHHLRVYPFK